MIMFFKDHFVFFVTILGLLGLIVGSFLNVIIYRLPIMIKNNHLNADIEKTGITAPRQVSLFNLYWPPSHCPHCKTPIPWVKNIPIMSFLLLGRQCQQCNIEISWRYPLVELITCIAFLIIAQCFGPSFAGLAAMIFTSFLIVMAFIDYEHQLLPDSLTLPLLWLGLIFTFFSLFCSLNAAILGAILGYLSLWALNYCYRLSRKKEGIGYGDFKLFAALGAWVGWAYLPFIILLASLMGLVFAGFLIVIKKQNSQIQIPFGPFLALAGWVSLLFGHFILIEYFKLI